TLTEFKNHYCLLSGFKEIIGYKNLGELRERVSNIMLRRLKEDVLDLPPKIRKREYVDMNAGQTKIYKEAVSKVKDEIDKVR
ncbi:SNF2-related protein, partial [Klebsiella pneumoniae]|uniref:SNF2-related protein n=1 Tax=Klebsiella pneumoniae TaxID=573 RepID=UPI003B5BCB8C